MNANEAISKIRFMLDVGGSDGFTSSDKEALHMAINALSAEVTAQPKTNADRIRQMTDEELADFMVIQAIMGAISANGIKDKAAANKIVKEIIMEHKSDEDISAVLIWLKQEASEDAESDTEKP